jgi:hypothetical protein
MEEQKPAAQTAEQKPAAKLLKINVKHDGKFYKAGSACPKELVTLFAKKGFI